MYLIIRQYVNLNLLLLITLLISFIILIYVIHFSINLLKEFPLYHSYLHPKIKVFLNLLYLVLLYPNKQKLNK